MSLLGQLPQPSSYQAVGWIVLGLAAIIVIVRNGIGLVREIKDKPAPSEVRAEAASLFTRREDCAAKHGDMERQIAQIRDQRIADAKDGAASRRVLYEQIEGVRKEVVESERRMNKADEDRTSALHARINAILEAVGELRGVQGKKGH